MRKYLLLSVLFLPLAGGVAMAQTSSYQSTTTATSAAPVAPPAARTLPPGTLSRTETARTNDGMGNSTYSRKTTYEGGNGSVSQSKTTTTTVTPPPLVERTYKRTTTTTTSSDQ